MNSRAPYTAETWAWMYQNRFYQNVWNWGGQGIPEELTLYDYSAYIADGDDEGQVDTDDGSDPAVPFNCVPAGTSTEGYSLVNCTFLGEDPDEWLLDQGYPCVCTEDGCSDTSPSCCADASCPTCDCSEDGCSDDSPDCCADSTCQWATTESVIQNVQAPANNISVAKRESQRSDPKLLQIRRGQYK